jgi:putative oxidoreductase
MFDRLNPLAPYILSLLRLVSGLIFMAHGTQKVLGFPATSKVTEMFSVFWFAGVIEVVCGVLIAVGFLTRATAFLASGTMAVAYWMAHAPRDFYPVNNGGDAAILYCFLFLYFVVAGGGAWSVDAFRRNSAI